MHELLSGSTLQRMGINSGMIFIVPEFVQSVIFNDIERDDAMPADIGWAFLNV